MGVLSRAGDLVYTLRFLRLLTTSWEDTNAYKLGIIDSEGKRIKSKEVSNSEEKSSYNYFHRLVFSLKRLLNKIPGGKSKIASYAAALYLVKEKLELTDKSLKKIMESCDIEVIDLLSEQSEWFITEDKMLSPGLYKIRENRIVNSTFEEIVIKNDKIRVSSDCYPVGEIFGLNVYEVTHVKTNQKLYVTTGELIR
jgi:hypothetical protein